MGLGVEIHILVLLFPSSQSNDFFFFNIYSVSNRGGTYFTAKCSNEELWRNTTHLTYFSSVKDCRVWAISDHIQVSVKVK